MDKIKLLCECGGMNCKLTITLPHEEALNARDNNQLIIINGCQKGPEPTDVFISEEKGYTIYKDK